MQCIFANFLDLKILHFDWQIFFNFEFLHNDFNEYFELFI